MRKTTPNKFKIIPSISSGTAGPLGVLHMPRFWYKALLGVVERMPDSYPAAGGPGFDTMLLDALNLDRAATLAFMETQPTYIEFEAWVKTQPGVKLDKETIDAFNASVLAYNHSDEARLPILGADGLDDASCHFRSAVDLNNLDDWQGIHASINTKKRTQMLEENADPEAAHGDDETAEAATTTGTGSASAADSTQTVDGQGETHVATDEASAAEQAAAEMSTAKTGEAVPA